MSTPLLRCNPNGSLSLSVQIESYLAQYTKISRAKQTCVLTLRNNTKHFHMKIVNLQLVKIQIVSIIYTRLQGITNGLCFHLERESCGNHKKELAQIKSSRLNFSILRAIFSWRSFSYDYHSKLNKNRATYYYNFQLVAS